MLFKNIAIYHHLKRSPFVPFVKLNSFAFSELKSSNTSKVQTQNNSADQNGSNNNSSTSQDTATPPPQKKSAYQQELERRYPAEKIAQVQKQLKEQKASLFSYLLAVNKETADSYKYLSDTLISNKIDYTNLKDNPKQVFFLLGLWSGVGYLASMASPYLVSIPAILGIGAIFQFFGNRRLVYKTIEKIEFVPNEIEKVYISLIKNPEKILCKIDSFEVIDVSERVEHPYISEKVFQNPVNGITLQKDISLTVNVQDISGVTHNALNLIIFGDKQLSNVPNYNLLTTVLEGDIIKLNKFKVNKKEEVAPDFIENLLAGKMNEKEDSAQRLAIEEAKKKQQEAQKEEEDQLEAQIRQEVQRFSKKNKSNK